MGLFSAPAYTNPADKAMPYMQQIPGTITPYYQPYVDAGTNSLATLMGQYQSLISDPGAVMNKMGAGFEESPGYQFQYNQGMNAANSAAASGGMLGTPEHQQNASDMSSNLANQDYYNYLSHVLGLYSQGMSGEEGTMKLGYGAGNELASSLAGNLQNEAGMAYAGQNNQNMADAQKAMFPWEMLGMGVGGMTGMSGGKNPMSSMMSLF